ncbi:MAG: hypothetical protein DRR04_06085 [Gammaproteobacteria bacterium]|nr:MAG: hypothetical protein DRQ97_05145 [Gammaproteobacteria bacterium]RLA60277.1 MAG: hypothetical protein DRR04_06085 [Gammaproteobacteria bacterium]
MDNHIFTGSVFFGIWVLSGAGMAGAAPETERPADPQPATAALIESYRLANPDVHNSMPAMAHQPQKHKSRQAPPAKARPGGSGLPLSMPAGKK